MQYRQEGYCHAHMLLYASRVNYNVNSNCTQYLAQLCGQFFYILENFHHKFVNLVAPPTDITTKRLVTCKAHLVL